MQVATISEIFATRFDRGNFENIIWRYAKRSKCNVTAFPTVSECLVYKVEKIRATVFVLLNGLLTNLAAAY